MAVYSIGHSSHTIETFIGLLEKHNINCLVDVRSVPYSRYSPQFNREYLSHALKEQGISYLFFGEEFGARREGSEYLSAAGRTDFSKVIASPLFQRGVQRIRSGMKKEFRIALMCAEKDPFECHRFALVSRGLRESGIRVSHILEDGALIDNSQLEARLIEKYHIEYGQVDIFGKCKSFEDAVLEGYIRRNEDIAYGAETEDGE